jgi:hypothetical protein
MEERRGKQDCSFINRPMHIYIIQIQVTVVAIAVAVGGGGGVMTAYNCARRIYQGTTHAQLTGMHAPLYYHTNTDTESAWVD